MTSGLWPKAGTCLDCPVTCRWLAIASNLRYCGCGLALRQQGIIPMVEKVITIRNRKVEDIKPPKGVTRLFHVVEKRYYNWDGQKWTKEKGQ